jgi:PAS domain S-box-containing protein
MKAVDSATPALTRRLIDRFLLVGIGSLLALLAAALVMASHGALSELTALVVLGPIALMLIGCVLLRRTVATHALIDEQLRALPVWTAGTVERLRPIHADNAAALGWNLLVQQLGGLERVAEIESQCRDRAALHGPHEPAALLDALPEGIAVCDLDGTVALANRTLAVLIGTEHGAALEGRSLPELLRGGQNLSDAAQQKLEAACQYGVFDLARGDETTQIVLRVARSPLVEPRADAERVLWMVRDVTHQKLAEQMRDQFIFTATHELRTPLANIKAYAETLAMHDQIDIEKQKEFFNIINGEATRLARFIDELLNVSQMEAGALSLARQDTDLARLVTETVQNVQPQIQQKRIEFTATLSPKLPTLLIDKDKVAAALTNLLGNAVKYTPDGGCVTLRVEEEGGFIHFHVEDTGIGIAKEELSCMFQKFFRSQDPRVQKITGSGLGLAFTQEVARLHNGRVTVYSELNKGSRFTFSLPLPSEVR